VRVVSVLGLMVLVLAVGAGCGGSSDPASQIRANEHQMLSALRGNNLAKVCSYMTERGKCIASMAMAKAFLGTGNLSDLMTEQDLKKAEKEIDTDPIRVSEDGKRATVPNSGGDPDVWVKVGGDWKIVYR
jgi:hypothetical protein